MWGELSPFPGDPCCRLAPRTLNTERCFYVQKPGEIQVKQKRKQETQGKDCVAEPGTLGKQPQNIRTIFQASHPPTPPPPRVLSFPWNLHSLASSEHLESYCGQKEREGGRVGGRWKCFLSMSVNIKVDDSTLYHRALLALAFFTWSEMLGLF